MTSEILNADTTRTESLGTAMAIFVGGAALGAIAALLLAPQAGRESRKQLSEYGRRTGNTMREWATGASGLFDMGENVKQISDDASGKHLKQDEVVKSRPHAVAH